MQIDDEKAEAILDNEKHRIGMLAFDKHIPSIVKIVDVAYSRRKGKVVLKVKTENGKIKNKYGLYLEGQWVTAEQQEQVQKQKNDYLAEVQERIGKRIGMLAFDKHIPGIVEIVRLSFNSKGQPRLKVKTDQGKIVMRPADYLNGLWVTADHKEQLQHQRNEYLQAKLGNAKQRIGMVAFDERIPSIVKIVDVAFNKRGALRLQVEQEDGKVLSKPTDYMGTKWQIENNYQLVKQQEAIFVKELAERKDKDARRLEPYRERILKYRNLVSDDGNVLIDAHLELCHTLNDTSSVVVTVKTADNKLLNKSSDWFENQTWMSKSDRERSSHGSHQRAIARLWDLMQSAKKIDKQGMLQEYRDKIEAFAEDAEKELLVTEYDQTAWNNYRMLPLENSTTAVAELLKYDDSRSAVEAITHNFDELEERTPSVLVLKKGDSSWILGDDSDSYNENEDRFAFFSNHFADKQSLLALLAEIIDSKEELEAEFSTIVTAEHGLVIVAQALGREYNAKIHIAEEKVIQFLDMLNDWFFEFELDLESVEYDVASAWKQKIFQAEYLPMLIKQYQDNVERFSSAKSAVKTDWNERINTYKQSNDDPIEQRLFTALSAMHILNHVAKTLQNYRSNASSFDYDLLQKTYGSADEIYRLKNELLLKIYQKYPEYLTLKAFIPDDADKISVQFCSRHFDDFNDERYFTDCTPMEYYWENEQMINQCSRCNVSRLENYYSMYYFKIKLPGSDFSFHEPYPIGKGELPELKELPQAQQEYNQEGMFLFGREADFDETCLSLAVDLLTPINDFLNL